MDCLFVGHFTESRRDGFCQTCYSCLLALPVVRLHRDICHVCGKQDGYLCVGSLRGILFVHTYFSFALASLSIARSHRGHLLNPRIRNKKSLYRIVKLLPQVKFCVAKQTAICKRTVVSEEYTYCGANRGKQRTLIKNSFLPFPFNIQRPVYFYATRRKENL